MASSEVDRKFLGRFAKNVEHDNPLLASVLFRVLGLSISLSSHIHRARKRRRLDDSWASPSVELYLHVIWLAREGLLLLEQYILPMVGNFVELKVLAYKLRASFYHIFVLFHNTPSVSATFGTHECQTGTAVPGMVAEGLSVDKGKGLARDDVRPTHSLMQPVHGGKGGAVGPPPGFGHEPATAFLLKPGDYRAQARQCFQEAVHLADTLLWGSHSLRLSAKTEYAAFLYESVHDTEASRKLAKDTIAEVYEAPEGIDNDMFSDACELVTVLGEMVSRGLPSSSNTSGKVHSPRSRQPSVSASASQRQRQQHAEPPATVASPRTPPGMF